MALTCTICDDPRAADIEQALGDGAPQLRIAHTFDVSRHALGRHVRNGHGAEAEVVRVASSKALTAKDLDKRRHALLALADAEVRRAERAGNVAAHLRSSRGYRAALRQSIWREAYRDNPSVVTAAQRADLERSWRRAVAAFESARSWQERLAGLEGLREALGQLYRASPPEGASLVELLVTFDDGTPIPGPSASFWTSDERLRSGGSIQLAFDDAPPWPAKADESKGEGDSA